MGVLESRLKEHALRDLSRREMCLQDCAYLCNMAVTPDWRRHGYGLHLLSAAEMVAQLAGKQEIYLHVRFVAEGCLVLQATMQRPLGTKKERHRFSMAARV